MSLKSLWWRLLGVNHLSRQFDRIERTLAESVRYQSELLMADKFHDTVINSEWLKIQAISPGGWAVDYGFLYSLYRILDVMHPTNILEFGLGQSSKLIHQYASFYKCNAITIEHDQRWIEHFKNEIRDNYEVNVKRLNLIQTTYRDYPTNTYEDLQTFLSDNMYDLIVVDAPFGTEHFSRSQIVEIARNNLSDRFCILIDDYNRLGEQETGLELLHCLDKKQCEYESTIKTSSKDHFIVCSKDLHFLLSI